MDKTDKNTKPNSLEDSLMEMRNQLAERAKELTSLQKTISFGVPSGVIEALHQYRENIAEVQKHIAPYSRMMTEAIKQWDKQRKMIIPVIEKIAEPMRIVQDAISRYPKMETNMLRLEPNYLLIPPKETLPPRINEKALLAEIKRLENKVDELLAKDKQEKTDSQEPKVSGNYKIYRTSNGIELKFNSKNGNVELGEVKTNIAPGTQEHTIFVCLLESSSFVTKYKTLLSLLYPGQTFEGSIKMYPIEKGALECAIKKTKMILGILPKKNAKNKDIFKVMARDKSYSLLLKD